jgi:hypothetical protein
MFYRSTIANLQEDGSVEAIHLYFDSDISNTYLTLGSDYRTREKIEELLNLGHLISLGRYIGSENPIYRPSREICLSFTRDDHLAGMDAEIFGTVESWLGSFYMCQAAYLFDGKDWLRFERIDTERKLNEELEVLGYWINSMGSRVTEIFDFATRSKLKGASLTQPDSLIKK